MKLYHVTMAFSDKTIWYVKKYDNLTKKIEITRSKTRKLNFADKEIADKVAETAFYANTSIRFSKVTEETR
jgi:hypothetical protein